MRKRRQVVGALVVAGMVLPGMMGSASAQDASVCEQANGVAAGTKIQGYTVAYGSGGSGHQIVLGYGDTYLSGGSGNDVICAWGGGNTLDGESGNDVLIVMEGTGNTLIGASGNDILIGYVGDTFNGGSGRNEIVQNEVPAPEVDPAITAVVTANSIGGGAGFLIDVTGTGFTPGGDVTFSTDFLSGYDFTAADTSGAFGPYQLNTGGNPGQWGIWACAPIGNPGQMSVTATDVSTGMQATQTVDLPCR